MRFNLTRKQWWIGGGTVVLGGLLLYKIFSKKKTTAPVSPTTAAITTTATTPVARQEVAQPPATRQPSVTRAPAEAIRTVAAGPVATQQSVPESYSPTANGGQEVPEAITSKVDNTYTIDRQQEDSIAGLTAADIGSRLISAENGTIPRPTPGYFGTNGADMQTETGYFPIPPIYENGTIPSNGADDTPEEKKTIPFH